MTQMKTSESKVFHIHSERDVGLVTESLIMMRPTEDEPLLVQIGPDTESRSLKQNRLSFLWYKYLGKETGEGMQAQRAICKLRYGIPILREDMDFESFYQIALARLTYEDQIDAMEYVSVTRLMKVNQFAEYLNEIDRQSAAKGIVLPQPDELYWNALMKESERK